MISVVRSGKNPTMRHLERSHGVAVTWMHDMFESGTTCIWPLRLRTVWLLTFIPKLSVIPENEHMRVCKSDCWSRKC